MRSASLFAVLGLVFVLAVSSFSPVAAAGYIEIHKVTTNGDTTTTFVFDASGASGVWDFVLTGAGTQSFPGAFHPGEYTITEQVPEGWVLESVDCADEVVNSGTDFDYIPGGVIITVQQCGSAYCFVLISCTFTNSPTTVGGFVMSANTLALVAPWIAVLSLLCIGALALVAKRHR